MTEAVLFDGRSLKAVSFGSAISDSYYTSTRSASGANALKGFTAQMAYDTVAYAFRCVTKRAEECSRVPFTLEDEAGRDVSEEPQFKSILPSRQLLFDLEVSRCLYGAAYAPITANASGYNVGLEWAASPSIKPNYDPMTDKVRWFERTAPRMVILQLDQIVYVWNRNYSDENRPGLGETEVALGAASTLFALDATLAKYLNAGAVPVWMVPVDPTTQDEAIKKEQNFYNRMVSGINNSWRYIVARMTKDRAPIKLGSDIKEMEAKELSESQKASIAEAHSIPPNIVDGTYKYATADSEYLGFVAGTIVPRVEQTFERLNAQYYTPRYGLKLNPQPKKMEIYQSAFLEQAKAVKELVGKPPLTLDEGREILEMGPMVDDSAVPVPVTINGTATPLPLNEDGDRPQPIGGQPKPLQLSSGGENPVPIQATSGPKPVPVKASPEFIRVAMGQWRDGALKALKAGRSPVTASNSIYIPDADSIRLSLQDCKTAKAVRAVFERHWPHEPAPAPDPTQNPYGAGAVAALTRATDVLERAMEMAA